MSEARSPFVDQPDEELVRLVLAGEVEVFAHLYHRYYARVYRLAYGMLGQHEAAEDLTQEVFIRVYRKMELFGGQAKFSTWLYRLASNHALNYCESKQKIARRETSEENHLPVPSRTDQMEKKVYQKEVQEQIHKALFTLKPKYRLLIILKDIEGLSYEEIAEQVNCSTGTLAAQLKRARNLLGKKLAHLRGAF